MESDDQANFSGCRRRSIVVAEVDEPVVCEDEETVVLENKEFVVVEDHEIVVVDDKEFVVVENEEIVVVEDEGIFGPIFVRPKIGRPKMIRRNFFRQNFFPFHASAPSVENYGQEIGPSRITAPVSREGHENYGPHVQ